MPEQRSVPVKTIYEDDHMAVVCKPQNIPTQGQGMPNLHSCLPAVVKLPSDAGPGPLWRPWECHR